ncbi:MAG: glycosyltransferase family 2 protein [Akkermansia sp.]|nr:glycosyltransferase family 2 protein [Akkermansia sp.]
MRLIKAMGVRYNNEAEKTSRKTGRIMHSESPQLTVIMPVYNASAYLEEAVRSVLASGVEAVELLCVDDGSIDGSGEMLDAMGAADARVRVWHQANAGASAARNAALQQARGRYVTFVDADDKVSPTYLRTLVETAERSGADCVVTGWTRFSDAGDERPHPIAKAEQVVERPTARDLASLPSQMCARLYKQSVLQCSGAMFPPGIQYGEDTIFHYCVYPWCRKIVILPENGYYYRAAAGSLSAARSERVVHMADGAEFLAGVYQLKGADGGALLVHFINHALKRIRSMAPHQAQQGATERIRRVLRANQLEELVAQELRRRDAAVLQSILRGGSGLNAGYYWKRFTRMLRGK